MAYTIRTTNRYDKNVKLCQRRGLPMEELKKAVLILEQTGTLPSEYRPHKLTGRTNSPAAVTPDFGKPTSNPTGCWSGKSAKQNSSS